MNVIYVAWQDPESRQWTPVGCLSKQDDEFRFVYTQGAEKSKHFKPFGRMYDLHTAYKSSELFPLFANRVLPKSRPEYDRYLYWLGMSGKPYDVMEELSRTAGIRATDNLELFPCPEEATADNNYEVDFFSRGLRHMHMDNQERAKKLQPGEHLYLMQDLQNSYDAMALLMRTNDPVSLVGYAPRYYSTELTELIKANGPDKVKVTVQQVNPEAPIQYRVLCKLNAPWPNNFMPCSDDRFKTLA